MQSQSTPPPLSSSSTLLTPVLCGSSAEIKPSPHKPEKTTKYVVDKQETKQESQSVYQMYSRVNSADALPLPSTRLEQIKQALYENYQKRAVMFKFLPHPSSPITVPITEYIFIHLAVVTQKQQQQRICKIREQLKQHQETSVPEKALENKREDLQCQQLLNGWEMLSQGQEPMSLNALWLEHKSDQGIPQYLLIEGSAGIGKTTLCGFIAAQWSQQKLWTEQFAWLLWIPLRNLIDTSRYPQLANYNYSVKSFVLGECFGCLPNAQQPHLTLAEQDILWQQLEEQTDRVLYILDGYDEIAGHENYPELAHLKTAIPRLLESKHILLTTRPQAMNDALLPKKQTRRLVTLGLSDENIPRYVEHYFKTIDSPHEEKQVNTVEEKYYDSAALLGVLKANQPLWSVSHIPLHLSLICLAYAEGAIQAADLKQNLSLTELYQQIVNILLNRYLKEKSKDRAEIAPERITAANIEIEDKRNRQQITQCLEALAFHGMEQYDLILNDKLINDSIKSTNQEPTIIRDLVASGFLKEVNDQGKPGYQFLHLTFQEFFAARYFAKKLQQPQRLVNDWIEYFHKYKHIPRFAVMLWFKAGLLRYPPACLQQFFQLLQAPPRDEVGLYHLGLVMGCVAEAGYPKGLTTQISQHLGQLVKKCWLVTKEGNLSEDVNKRIKAKSANKILQWLGQQRLLTVKIEFPVSSLNAIVKDLSCKDSNVRQLAAKALGKLMTSTPEILLALVTLLKDDESEVRYCAAQALGELKTPTAEVVHGLFTLLKDRAEWVSKAAARSLRELKVSTPELLQILVDLLKDNYSDVRQAAAEGLTRALEELKVQTPEILFALVAMLKDEKWQAREGAARALGKLKTPTPEILPGLAALLKDEIYLVRQAAAAALARALGKLKAQASEILLDLVAMLNDKNWHARDGAVQALGELEMQTPEILAALIALLKDQTFQVRESAARALGKFTAPNLEILPSLMVLLKDNDADIKQTATQALGELRAPILEILLTLVTLLNDNDRYIKEAAVKAVARGLGELKMLTPEILLTLVTLLKNVIHTVREAATEALTRALRELKAPTSEILLAIVALLKNEKWQVRAAATRVLGVLNSPTPEILLALVALLKDDENEVRYYAARALGELKVPTPEILPGLMVLLKDNDPDVRQAAAEALGELKTPTPELLLGLVALLKDDSCEVKYQAAEALGELEVPTPEILQSLVALLKDEKWQARAAAARALGKLKILTPEILKALAALLKDEYSLVRQAAAKSLNSFSTASLLNIYFQQSCKWYQSSLQECLFNLIGQRWLVNRQVVKFANQDVLWLEQGQWYQLPIPNNHPHFQHYIVKTMQELMGPALTLTFSKHDTAENVRFFSARSSSLQPALTAEQKDPQQNKGFGYN